MKNARLIVFFFAVFFSLLHIKAQNINVVDTASNIQVEDLSFLFDETITKIGADFSREFHSEWDAPVNIAGVSVYVGEKPIPGMGTQIWIKVGERIVYRSVLRPNPEKMKKEVEKALAMTRNYFINYETIQKQLGSQDYSGNGIY
ncbi:CsgE family curli-type amyloid fiber assembly protein [Marinilabilia rubra]|uniref:Curli production assembly/transport component CsgE n=1 Tax=Marinilabilia rubra TaxID=2162893 RepID=A0A2U2B402_9BACT|nr:CsgE family curli-type amyloid fiber assembly protein [Marinilabilia rubra]PWD97790.1 hypothetical protein DDZ16_18905 [Marinilabilia rubra]